MPYFELSHAPTAVTRLRFNSLIVNFGAIDRSASLPRNRHQQPHRLHAIPE
jgi:hypothetical protein